MSTLTILSGELSKHGYQARCVPVSHLSELKQSINEIVESGDLSPEHSDYIKRCFTFKVPAAMPDARSIIIAALQSLRCRAYFNYKGERFGAFIPPAYVDMYSAPKKIGILINEIINPFNYHAERARLPEKLLAIRSGLGRYGRNNICYIPGMGSFVRMSAFFSDMPCEDDCWQDVKVMEACAGCVACRNICPTGSIRDDRFLLDADRCICKINESAGDFPAWLDPSWHNSLVGCFFCQETCPQNKKFIGQIIDMAEFTSAETDMIMNEAPLDDLPMETRSKLEQINMAVYYDCLSRNLKALMANRKEILS